MSLTDVRCLHDGSARIEPEALRGLHGVEVLVWRVILILLVKDDYVDEDGAQLSLDIIGAVAAASLLTGDDRQLEVLHDAAVDMIEHVAPFDGKLIDVWAIVVVEELRFGAFERIQHCVV